MRDALPKDHVCVATENLAFGMFVAGLDRPWRETPFAVQGFIIEDRRQLDALRLVCNEVVVDRSRSNGEAVAHLKPSEPPKPKSRHPLLAALTTIFRPRAWLFHGGRLGRQGLASAVLRQNQRLEALNANTGTGSGTRMTVVDLRLPKGMQPVEYPDDTTIEDAIAPARTAYVKIESTMKNIIIDLAQNKEISADAVSGAATELVEIIAMNSEAMMWLARMRARNALAYAKSVQLGQEVPRAAGRAVRAGHRPLPGGLAGGAFHRRDRGRGQPQQGAPPAAARADPYRRGQEDASRSGGTQPARGLGRRRREPVRIWRGVPSNAYGIVQRDYFLS
jgi:hypothetical protein